MQTRISPDIFITTLTEMLHHIRDCRAAELMPHSKIQTKRVLRDQAERSENRVRASHRHKARPAEEPDCVLFFSSTLKGAAP